MHARTTHSHPSADPPPRSPRAGFTVVEVTLAVMLAATFGAVLAPMLVQVAQHRQLLLREQYALIHLSNVLDDLTTCAPEEFAERRDYWTTGAGNSQRARLPGAELTLESAAASDAPPGLRIVGVLSWADQSGEARHVVRLVGWNYQTAEGRP